MKKLHGLAAIASAMLLPLATLAAPVNVYFVPSTQAVGNSTTGTVQVWVDNAAAIGVGSFDLNIHADNANLTWTSAIYSAADPLGDGGANPGVFFSAINGSDIDVQGYSLLFPPDPIPAAQTDPFLLFTLDFSTGAAVGPTGLSFTSYGGSPLLGTNVTDWNGNYQANATFGTACVLVGTGSADCGQAPMPEPASYGLAAIALAAAGLARRRSRRGVAAA